MKKRKQPETAGKVGGVETEGQAAEQQPAQFQPDNLVTISCTHHYMAIS